jgi:hypothetical protein
LPTAIEQMYDAAVSERLLSDPRFQPQHIVGAVVDGRVICTSHVSRRGEDTAVTVQRVRELLEGDRLHWLTRASALASGSIDCEDCGRSLDGLG